MEIHKRRPSCKNFSIEKEFVMSDHDKRNVDTPETGGLGIADIASSKRPKGVKLEEVVALKKRGFSDTETGKQLGVSRQAVAGMLKRSGVDLADVEVFKEAEPDILAGKRKLLLDSITAKDIAATKSVRDRCVSYGILTDKARLLSGESTANVAINSWCAIVHQSMAQRKAESQADDVTSSGILDREYLARCRKTAQGEGRLDEQLTWERDTRRRLNIKEAADDSTNGS
jgi:hypothetical protein